MAFWPKPSPWPRTGQGFKCTVAASSTNSMCNCGEAKRETKIINGFDTEVNEYPWMVKISNGCGGSIISPFHILTAARCGYGLPSKPIPSSVVVGEHDLGDTEESETQTIPVAEILLHPDYYDSDLRPPEIAILTLASPIAFSASAAPVCLPASVSPQYAGQVATLTGWGAVDNWNTWNSSGEWNDYPDILQETQLTVVSNTECGRLGIYR